MTEWIKCSDKLPDLLIKELFKCDKCSKEVDGCVYLSISCSKCKKSYCSERCSDDHYESGCRNTLIFITNPQWICNLVNSLKKEKDESGS